MAKAKLCDTAPLVCSCIGYNMAGIVTPVLKWLKTKTAKKEMSFIYIDPVGPYDRPDDVFKFGMDIVCVSTTPSGRWHP